jgi:hypothetical protein
MIQPAREIIYGVCDKTGNCDSYFGFFKSYEDAQKEVKVQSDRLKEDLGLMEIEVREDRAVLMKTDRVETVVIIIHNFVLR